MSETIRVVNPATSEVLTELPVATSRDVADLVGRARRAQPAWAALPFAERARRLRRFVAGFLDDQTLIDTIVAETGKPRYEAEGMELFYLLELCRHLSGRAGRRALADETRGHFLFAHKRSRVVRSPLGVVGVVGPWNWPLLNNFADAIPALLAGNAVVLKPSPVTPLTSLHVRKRWQEDGMPEDVFQVAVGGGDVGEALVGAVDLVFFTGSARTGRHVARAAGERLVPVVLELGGKSAMVVLADADLEAAARAAVWSAFVNTGQACVRTERVLVEASVADAFTDRCLALTKALRQGPPRAEGGADVGPMTFAPQLEHIEAQLADAVARGARILTGGRRRSELGDRYFEPTIVVDVRPGMRIAEEETFGPVLTVMTVPDAEAAIARANELDVGLAGSVWSKPARARALARRLETGTVSVNGVLQHYLSVESPLGGIKRSGLGFRHGAEALRQFCRTETIFEDRPLIAALAPWLAPYVDRTLGMPYQPRVLRLIRRALKLIYGRWR